MKKLAKVLGGVLLTGGLTFGASSYVMGNDAEQLVDEHFDKLMRAPSMSERNEIWKDKDISDARSQALNNIFWGSVVTCGVGCGLLLLRRPEHPQPL